MSLNLEDVLKNLGWTDGFQIPIANAENKALEEELAKLSLRKQKGKTGLEILSSRLEGLNDHYKYVIQENEQTQKLITAHKQQLDALEDAYHTTKAENQNTLHAIKTGGNQLKEAEDLQTHRKSDLIKQVARADKLKAEMDWDAEALKAWDEALKKRDEDIELLRKFFQDDDRRFNHLEARRQHLQNELGIMRKKIARIAATSDNCEQMIQRSGKVMKQLTVERDALITQWKASVKMLQQRDSDIMKSQEQLCHVQEMIEKQQEKLEEENTFLENEKRNNRTLEMEIQEANNANSRLKREMADMYQVLLTMNTDYHTLKRQVSTAANHLKNERLKGKRMDEQFTEKEALCAQYTEEVATLQKKLEEVKNSAMTSEERIKSIEKIIEQEEKLYNINLADIEKTNGVLFRSEQTLKEQREIGKNLAIEIDTGACTTAQLRKHIQTERKELERIKEVVYEMEFRIDECEKKLYELSEVKYVEVSEEKQQKLDELEKTLSDYKELQHSLQIQVDRLREEMRRLTTVITADKEVLDTLKNKCENFLLVYEISQKHIVVAKRSVQEKQVEENMMRLRINQIEKDKKKEEKQIFNLEKFKLNLEQLKELEADLQDNEATVEQLEDEIFGVKKQEIDKTEKLKRVDCELKKLSKQLFVKERQDIYKYIYHTLKRQVSTAANHLKNERLKGKRMDEQFTEKEALCAQYTEEVAALQKKLEEVKNSAMTSEERIKSIEKIIEQEEKLYNINLADIEKTNGVLFRSEQTLKEQREIGKNLAIEIDTGACTTAQLRKHIQTERKELERIKEVVYEMEFRIDECEKKLYELSEVKYVEVSEEKQQKLDELEKTLSDYKEVRP
uniref:Coiled-coil domain-containing protein 39 n=1 Tax=Diabrotica virgifera virgifera TaxID=50390 RepID=A0A6P7GYN5_DIAVI